MNTSISISPSLPTHLGTTANGIRDRHDPDQPERIERPLSRERSRQSSLVHSIVDLPRGAIYDVLGNFVTSRNVGLLDRLAVPM